MPSRRSTAATAPSLSACAGTSPAPPRPSASSAVFGVLSSHSALRREVVPKPPSDLAQSRPPAAPGDQLLLAALGGDNADADEGDARPPARKRWAWLLAHVFRADLDTCPRCGGPMRWVEA